MRSLLRGKKSSTSTRVIFPTDEHHPYADLAAIELAQKIAEDFNPDIRIAGSDGVDFYSLSKFDKNPTRAKTIEYERDEWMQCQRSWRDATPNARAIYIIGNHEFRLQRFLWRYNELATLEMLKIHNFMKLDELGIEYDPSDHELANREVQVGNLLIKHGSLVRKYSGYSARGELEREFYQTNVLTGHTHRGGVTYTSTRNGVLQGVEGFCLCDLRPPYVDRPDWQQGIVLAEVFENGDVHFDPVLIRRRMGEVYARWQGKEYQTKCT